MVTVPGILVCIGIVLFLRWVGWMAEMHYYEQAASDAPRPRYWLPFADWKRT